MTIDPSWVAAIASAVSALVVGVTAVAAFSQIRQMRATNEINVYLRLFDRLDKPETTEAYRAIEPFLERLRDDPDLRERLKHDRFVPEMDQVVSFLEFFESLSTLVATRRMSEELVVAEYAENIVDTWEQVKEIVYLRRQANSRYTGATFEHLAMRSRAYLESGKLEKFYARLERDPNMATFG